MKLSQIVYVTKQSKAKLCPGALSTLVTCNNTMTVAC